ncbi:glycosyltransferase family 2 protein [Ochrobactrum haematophilum]|uniref:Glycosyltransferase family 2 protein n=1 Tax=Brucella haematophila TaxID=419474 RepID=A0ABX1DIY1_9HYPH|nr:glycosyltransferase family 2 protein [Brucella haematophila]
MISLIVTTYNHARYIGDALASVLTQDVPDLQVIVVDDGSTDGTLGIAQEFEVSGVEVLSKANGGPSSALNHGMSRARRESLLFFCQVMTCFFPIASRHD